MTRLLILLPLVAILASTGCSTIKRTAVEIAPPRTNVVQVVVTNTVAREVWSTNTVQVAPQRTNELGVVLPPLFSLQPVRELISTQVLQTNLQPVIIPAIYYTNLALGDPFSTAIQAAGDLAPVPWGGLAGHAVTGLAGVVFGVINLFAKRKALRQAGLAQETTADFKRATETLIQNAEDIRLAALKTPGYTDAHDANVMKGIKAVQQAANVAHIIAPLVDRLTGDTKAQAAHATQSQASQASQAIA